MLKRSFAILVMVVMGGVLLVISTIWAEPPARHRAEFEQGFGFLEVNPVIPGDERPDELYIWMPHHSYQVGERIPLYVETFISPSRAVPGLRRVHRLLRDLVFDCLHTLPTCGRVVQIGYPLVRKAPFEKPIRVIMKRFKDVKLLPPEAYFPDPKTIPTYWLHGNPVKHNNLEYIRSMRLYEVEVRLTPGESFVRRIPNLLDFWVTKKGKDGRVYVWCVVPSKKTSTGLKGIWLPIEGRYKVQFYNSNIIEFEIRQ